MEMNNSGIDNILFILMQF